MCSTMLQVSRGWKLKDIENESLVICPALKEYLWYPLDSGRIAPLQLSYNPTMGPFPQKGSWSGTYGNDGVSGTGEKSSAA